MKQLVEQARPLYLRLVEQIVLARDAGQAEQYLADVFELGRSLMKERMISPDDVVSLHHEAIVHLARTYPDAPLGSVAEQLTRPMLEMFMAYGLAHGMAFREHVDQLLARERQFRTLVENSNDSIVRYSVDGRALYVNPAHECIFGLPAAQLIGKRLSEVFPEGTFLAYEKAILRVAATGEPAQIEQPLIAADGALVTHQINLVAERDSGGVTVAVLTTGRDISDILHYQQKMHALALTDVLTGLPNRALFNKRIRQEQAEAAREASQFGLMLLDLDNFKTINDALGHAVGDRLLQQVARRLEKNVRAIDSVAHLGGDEFVVIRPKVRDKIALGHIAGHLLKALAEPYQVDRHELLVSASIGITIYPEDSADVDALLKYADLAMYHAKLKGRNNFQHYTNELMNLSNDRMQMKAALRKAVERGELELHYQPQVDIASGRIVGAEALLRWNRGEIGVVMPNQFIPLAEETGLIVGIGDWVLAEACVTACAWNREREVPLRVAVNLSTHQLVKNDLVATLCRLLAETACRPEWLELEITESLLLEDSDDVLATLNRLTVMGLSISIDDFGTGYSALSYLNRFPVSEIKIDRSFVAGIPDDRAKAELVKALIMMAHALRLDLVAEGVETHQQAAYLQALGCKVAQGYLFGKPMPRREFEAALLNQGESDAAARQSRRGQYSGRQAGVEQDRPA
jgi:diguanylate cyclase (GGDEF)-like protein/PAS domain S-box-containing protein